MKKNKSLLFQIYRYQILPISQTLQLSLLEDQPKSIEELIKRKNKYFFETITNVDNFSYSHTETIHKVKYSDDNFILLLIGANRSIDRSTKDFKIEHLDNWPSVLVAISNKPDIQKVAVQIDKHVFSNTSTVIKLLEENINARLKTYQLRSYFESIFEPKTFWDIVETYSGKITQTNFELISPNMANISDSLEIELGPLHKNTNTVRTNLELNSPPDSVLTLQKGDKTVDSLVDYSSKGGGNISLRVKGLNKKIHTSNNAKEISIDEMEIQNATPKELSNIFRNLLT
ncbi:MAG: hypothetical protein ACOCUT_00915 [bacterium]